MKDARGHEITGLSPLPVRNKAGELLRCRYYATYSKPRVYFGYDLPEAIATFRRWQSDKAEKVETVAVHAESRLASDDLGELMVHYGKHGAYPWETDIPESAFWERVSEVFATKDGRNKAARLTGYSLIMTRSTGFDHISRINGKGSSPLSLRQP